MDHEQGALLSWPLGKGVLQKLTTKKYRQKFGLYLLEGSAAVRDAIEQGGEALGVLHDARALDRGQDRDALEQLRASRIPVQEVDATDLKRMSDLATPPPVIAVLRADDASEPTLPLNTPLVVALDRVADPGNVGTLLRAAAFYGVHEVWLGLGTAERYNPKVLRSAMSAHLHVRICPNVDLDTILPKAQAQGARVLAAVVEGAEPPFALMVDDAPSILLLGNEPHGIRPELVRIADRRIAIRRRGPVDSLNVAMAGTVLIDRLLTDSSTGA